MTCFHQNRQTFSIGTTQGQIIVYDLRSASKWRLLDGHTGAISAIGFDFSGKHICSYSATDRTVRVWFLASGGVAGAGPVVVNGAGQTSVLSGLLGTSGGKCLLVKQLGPIDEGDASGIHHPFNLVYRIQSVKIRWTRDSEVLVMRENGQGVQVRI
jgi:WD40 repeat protein